MSPSVKKSNTIQTMGKTGTLDRTDFSIIAALRKNARLPNNKLAQKVGIAPSTCLERVRRLVATGALKGFYAEVDPDSVGIGLQAMITVQLRRHSRDLVESFRSHATTLNEVLAVYHVAGSNDFLIHAAVRDADHLRDLAMDAFTTRPEVSRIETNLIFEYCRTHELPNYRLEQLRDSGEDQS
jgi:DNA-binding Lrp family transcriptional regulator